MLPPPARSNITSPLVSEEVYIVTRLLQFERFHPFTRRRDCRLGGGPVENQGLDRNPGATIRSGIFDVTAIGWGPFLGHSRPSHGTTG